jgi:hypothetical protein
MTQLLNFHVAGPNQLWILCITPSGKNRHRRLRRKAAFTQIHDQIRPLSLSSIVYMEIKNDTRICSRVQFFFYTV